MIHLLAGRHKPFDINWLNKYTSAYTVTINFVNCIRSFSARSPTKQDSRTQSNNFYETFSLFLLNNKASHYENIFLLRILVLINNSSMKTEYEKKTDK